MGGDEDDPLGQTTQFSVATLRDLVARSSAEEGDSPVDSPELEIVGAREEPGAPGNTLIELAKGSPILVFRQPSEAAARAVPTLLPAPPIPRPSPVVVSEPAVVLAPSVLLEAGVVSAAAAAPAPALARPAPAFPTRPAFVPVVAKPLARRAVRARRKTTLGGFLARRLFALMLLAVAVASQPWWWNVGEVSPHRASAARSGVQSHVVHARVLASDEP